MIDPRMVLAYLASSGITLLKDDAKRGLMTGVGLAPLHNLPIYAVDEEAFAQAVEAAGGFGVFVCRKPENLGLLQKLIDGTTHSAMLHSGVVVGEEIGRAARLAKPELTLRRPSPRWVNSPTHPENLHLKLRDIDTTDGLPVPWIGGIKPAPGRLETVEADFPKFKVKSLADLIAAGEQILFFYDPTWTREQKVAMAIKAYSQVGEPYDFPELFSWWIKLVIPNSALASVCSTGTGEVLDVVGKAFSNWCAMNHYDPELIAPRDIFAFCADTKLACIECRCKFSDALELARKG